MTDPIQPHEAATDRQPTSRRELEAEVVRSRAQLQATLDELTTRLSPSYQASRIAQTTRRAAADVSRFVRGGGLPAGEPRARNAKVLLGAVALTATILVVATTRALRR